MAGDGTARSWCRLAGACEFGLEGGVERFQCMPLFEFFVIVVFGVTVGGGGRRALAHAGRGSLPIRRRALRRRNAPATAVQEPPSR